MKQALIYTLKVWLTSVTLGAVAVVAPMMSGLDSELGFEQGVSFMLTIILFTTVLSFCSWLLLFLFTYLLIRVNFKVTRIKIILSLIGFILALATILLVTHGSWNDEIVKPSEIIPYPVLIVAGIWFYRLEPVYVINEETLI